MPGTYRPNGLITRLATSVEPISANVLAVYEAPELTARSAQGFPRPTPIDAFHRLPWQGRAEADA